MVKPKLSYSTDEPLTNSEDDAFGRQPFAKRIAETIIRRFDNNNIVLAIYGKWGEGKTTLMNFIENELQEQTDFVCINFNPWRFSSEEQLIKGYFMKLAESLEESLETEVEKVGNWTERYLSSIAAFFNRSDFAKEVGHLLSNADLEELKNRIQNILIKNKRQVVVFMDDIDRLNKQEIQSIFRLIKLTANFHYLVYVLAFDDEVVADSLQDRYGTFNQQAGRRFLEKVVQVPISLPKISEADLQNYCFSAINRLVEHFEIKLTPDDVNGFVYNFKKGIEPRLLNARMAIRYINSLYITVPILKDEVNFTDLLLIEGIKIFYPKIYHSIYNDSSLFLGTSLSGTSPSQTEKEILGKQLELIFQLVNGNEIENLKELLSNLFPRLQTIYGNIYYSQDSEKEWAKYKRIASKRYFEKYFLYSIPHDDVSDQSVDSLISSLSYDTIEDIYQQFHNVIRSENSSNFLYKLQLSIENLNSYEGVKLATVIGLSGDSFPQYKQSNILPISTPFSRAASIVANLIGNIPDQNQRIEDAQSILDLTKPLSFGREIISWIRLKEPEDSTLSELEEKEQYLTHFAKRISKEISEDENAFDTFDDDAPMLLHIWSKYKSKNEVNRYVSKVISENPDNIFKIINTFNKLAYPMTGTKAPYKGDFDRDEYDFLVDTIDPEIIIDAIKMNYDQSILEIDKEDYPYSNKRDDNLLIKQFLWIHSKVTVDDDKK